MSDDIFEDWQPGDPAYSAAKVARNFRAIRAEFARLFGAGGRDAVTSLVQVGRSLVFKTAAGVELTGATLPLAPTSPKGDRIVGRRYEEGDLYRVAGSSYVVLKGHVATSNLAADTAAGNVTLHAAAGADAETFVGPYVSGQAYPAKTAVYTGTPGAGDILYYKAFLDAPAGLAPPNFPWALIAVAERREIRGSYSGLIPAGRALFTYPVARRLFLQSGLPGSRFVLGTAPSSALTLSVRKNGTEFATVSFAAGVTKGTVTMNGPSVLLAPASEDILTIHAPASADAQAADFAATLLADIA